MHASTTQNPCHSIGRQLEVARARIQKAIGSCMPRESLGGWVGTGDPRHFVPLHPSETEALERLRLHVDSLAARFRAAVRPTEDHFAASPSDIARTEALHGLDVTLANHAEALARAFEVRDL